MKVTVGCAGLRYTRYTSDQNDFFNNFYFFAYSVLHTFKEGLENQ